MNNSKQGYGRDVNPERVVPTFIHDGHSLFQSLAIIEYLDDIQPKPRLLPEDAKERAYARSLALMTVADAHPLVVPRVRNHLAKAFGADAKAIEDWGKHWTTKGLRPMNGCWRAAPRAVCVGRRSRPRRYLHRRPGRRRAFSQA